MLSKKINITEVTFFLSLLFIGADLVSIKLFGLTFRITNFFILIGFLLYIFKSNFEHFLPKKFLISSMMLLAAMLFSLPSSYDKPRTIAYIFWFIFYVFVMSPYLYNFALSNSPQRVLKLWFLTFRIQVLFLFFEFFYSIFSGELVRPHLWFYEPSYVAIYFSLYFGSSIYLKTNSKIKVNLDLCLSILGLLILASATAIFALILGILIAIFLSKNKIKYLVFTASFSFLTFLFLLFLFPSSEYYQLTFGFLENSNSFIDLFNKIMFRSGTRIIRFLWGWDAFLTHPLNGIGFGADQTYTKIVPIPEVAQKFVTPQDSAWGNPFVNPFIEALGTMGIMGFIFLLYSFALLIYLYKQSRNLLNPDSQFVLAIVVGVILLICTLQMEGTFLRYYVWSSYIIGWGMFNRIKMQDDINNINANSKL
jgi:O-antigen ligase